MAYCLKMRKVQKFRKQRNPKHPEDKHANEQNHPTDAKKIILPKRWENGHIFNIFLKIMRVGAIWISGRILVQRAGAAAEKAYFLTLTA